MHSPIPELNELKELQDKAADFLSDGFEISDYDDKSSFVASDLTKPDFLDRLIPFAQANGSGSEYAIWRVDDRDDLATLPIVVFGDEGGEHVVARDFRDLLRILGFDAEPMVDHDEVYYYRGEDDEHSGAHDRYVKWLRKRHDLRPARDADRLVKKAQDEFEARFREWIDPYLGD